MKKKSMIVLTSAFVLLSAFSCGGGGKATGTNEQSEKVVVNVPQFDADSAYLYVKNQDRKSTRLNSSHSSQSRMPSSA